MSLPDYNPWPHLTQAAATLTACRQLLLNLLGICASAPDLQSVHVRDIFSALASNLRQVCADLDAAVAVSREWELDCGQEYPTWAHQASRLAAVVDDAVWATDGQLRLLDTESLHLSRSAVVTNFVRMQLDFVHLCGARLAGVGLAVRPAPGEVARG